jgi:hypothetical protein
MTSEAEWEENELAQGILTGIMGNTSESEKELKPGVLSVHLLLSVLQE